MTKHKHEAPAAKGEPAAEQTPSLPQADEPKASEVAPVAADPVAAKAEISVFTVEIPHCLLGARTFVAKSADEAYALYKALGGITSHVHPQIVTELPVDSRGYAEAMDAWKAAREAEAKKGESAKE